MPSLSRMDKWCNGSFFEYRYHAYTEMVYYFATLAVIHMGVGVYALINMDSAGVDTLMGVNWSACNDINKFLFASAITSWFEGLVTMLAACTVASIMRSPGWAKCGLCALCFYATAVLAKASTLLLGVLWVWSNNGSDCETHLPTLFEDADFYLFIALCLFGVQLCLGSYLLMSLGLKQAISEGVYVVATAKEESHLLSEEQEQDAFHARLHAEVESDDNDDDLEAPLIK